MSYFHPDRMPVLPAGRRKAARRQLEEVVERSAAKSARRRGKPAAVAAGAAALVLATGAAAFAIASYQPVTNKSQARCYTAAEVSGFYTMMIVPGRHGTKAELDRSLSICAGLYRRGFLARGASAERPDPRPGTHPVPALVVCTMHDGSAAVFPGSPGTCAKLDLPSATR